MVVPSVRVIIWLVLGNAALMYYAVTRASRCNASLDQCTFVVTNRLNCGWMGGDEAPVETDNGPTLELSRHGEMNLPNTSHKTIRH
jgi:hypothetical protein